jgi:hypothetical protein
MIEDGSGLPGATSYLSTEEANYIIGQNLHVRDAWNALSAEDKEALLAWASRYLDERTRWNGWRTFPDSGLSWPRTGAQDRDGVQIIPNVIPRAVKVATAEMARHLMVTDRSAERDQDGLTRLKADVIELEFRDGYRLPRVPEHLQNILSGLGAVNGGGVQFKPVGR